MRSFLTRAVLLGSLCLGLLLGCANAPDSSGSAPNVAQTEQLSLDAASPGAAQAPAGRSLSSDAVQVQSASSTAVPDTPKLIRQADVDMRVEDYASARERIGTIVQHFDGYIGSERETRRPNYRIANNLTIRVEADRFEPLLDSLLTVAQTVEQRNINVRDVTEEYIDVSARLKAKRELEQRYLDLLDRARTVEDILKVERQLEQVRSEIESAEGRLQYLNNRIDLSTIQLHFYEQISRSPAVATGFFAQAAAAFVAGWDGLKGAVLFAIQIWPLLLALGLAIPATVGLVRRWRRRRSGATQADSEAVTAE